MGLTYTDKSKIILEAWGKFKVIITEDVVVGDLVSFYNQDDDYAVQFADESDSQWANAIALEAGEDGDEIWVALKAVIGTITAQSGDCGRGIPEAVYFAGEDDFYGAPLFLGEDGKMDDTPGTTLNQPVGTLLARDRILIDLMRRAVGSILIGEGATLSEVTNQGIKVDFALSLNTPGGFYGIESNVDYEPDGDSGYASPVGVVGRVTLQAGMTFLGGQAGMEGVRGHLNFENAAIVNQASSVFAGLRGVITKSGTPIFTAFDTIACLYCDNLCATNMAGIASTYGSALISLQNHGGTLDAGIIIRGGNKLSAIFKFVTCGGVINNGEKAGNVKNIKVNIDGTVYYWNVYLGN